MAIYKELLSSDIKTSRSYLNQLIDVLQTDISGSTSRRKYQHFVTGGNGPGVTSSLYQTVYDQDFTLQTANPMFDVTFGLRPGSNTVSSSGLGTDSTGKELFPSQSLMMREKLNVYRQFAQVLLGSPSASFSVGTGTNTTAIDEALFVSYKRLFSRDGIKDQTYAMQFYASASSGSAAGSNMDFTSISGSTYYTDLGSTYNKFIGIGGANADLVDASNTSRAVGKIFYDRGIAVYDLSKIMYGAEHVSGTIHALTPTGYTQIGDSGGNPNAKFIPDLLVSGSIDDVLDCLCSTRFQSGSLSAMTFQNVTNINSTLVFCRAAADEFNYSQNPTFVDSNNKIVVINNNTPGVERTFTFITTIGLYDANDNLLAVAKLSRPVEKNDEKDLTFRVRLDF